MKHIITVFKKEIKRYFTDPRMFLAIFLPGVLIALIYSVMGQMITSAFDQDAKEYTIYISNEPLEFKSFFDNDELKVTYYDKDLDIDTAKEMIINKELDLYVLYEASFYDDVISQTKVPNIVIYYNSASDASAAIYQYYVSCLDAFETALSNRFDVNKDIVGDLAKKEDISIRLITSLMPFLLIMLLFSGAMSFCVESVAGEKERGTIATLLATPTKRYEIILGKTMALSIISLASGAVSLLGLVVSLPKLMGSTISFDMYKGSTILMLTLIVLSTVLLFTTMILVISTIAKSAKEASSYAIPLMLVVMGTGISAFMHTSATTNLFVYFIPVYNSVEALIGIFSMTLSVPALLITFFSNLCYIGLLVLLLSKLFNSEKVMFNK